MSEFFLSEAIELRPGDCRERIKELPDNSIDSVVTDPPYALVSIQERFGKEGSAPTRDGDVYSRSSAGFMGQQWDTGETAFAIEFWREVYRVLKPGGHMAVFGGTRTYHRLAVAIEDAGFEIRDQLAWMYGTGFPKSHNIGKQYEKTLEWFDETERERGEMSHTGAYLEAQGTALKPAWEPICLARKPLESTVLENVLKWGTGGLNIDGCRVGGEPVGWRLNNVSLGSAAGGIYGAAGALCRKVMRWARYPANVVHDGSDEVVKLFPAEAGGSGMASGPSLRGGNTSVARGKFNGLPGHIDPAFYGDEGSAARFFYSAKADAEDRFGSRHPTIKPVDLMQWVARLITPAGGIVLDAFAGSGTTGEAAWREGLRAILIEREPAFCDDIRYRLKNCFAGVAVRKESIRLKRNGPGEMSGGLLDLMKED